MEAFKTLIWIVNIFAALATIVLVLMQQGKGADAGAAFGSGSAQGIMGSAGSANFLSRSTAIAATVFFISCLALGLIASHQGQQSLDFKTIEHATPASSAPANPASNAPVIPE